MGYNCEVFLTTYSDNNRLAIRLVDADDGCPMCTASVNMPDSSVSNVGCTYIKDYSENTGILEALIAAGIVRVTGKMATAGYECVDEVQVLDIPAELRSELGLKLTDTQEEL